jgi:hypothetical protein
VSSVLKKLRTDRRCEDKEMATTIQNFCENLQQTNCNNDVYQQRTRLDIELDELWKHLMNISKWKYQRKKKKRNMQVQLTKESKEFAQQQSKVWDPGRLQATTMQQQQQDK